jgi:histidyl-tRNA synthetase
MGAKGNVGKRMKQANKANARYVVLMGDDELDAGVVTLRDLDGGEQQQVARGDLMAALSGGDAA